MVIVGGLVMIIAGVVVVTSGIPRFPIYYGYPYTSIPIFLDILGIIMLIIETLLFLQNLKKDRILSKKTYRGTKRTNQNSRKLVKETLNLCNSLHCVDLDR